MKDYTFLYNLLSTNSPSGYEHNAVELVKNECFKNGLTHEFDDAIGNTAFSVGNGKIPFMISGHIDEIALQVQYIDSGGFIHFIKDGGVDEKSLIGKVVKIINDDNIIYGVIGKTPIHIEHTKENKGKVTKICDLKIDIGAENKKVASNLVSIGNPIVFEHPIYELGENRIASGGIDDKVGVYITIEVIKKLNEGIKQGKIELNNLKVYGVACTQEEVGGHGATLAAKRINPSFSIDYDVTFATDDECVSKNEWGDIKLGKGGCVAFGPDKNKEMCDDIIRICKNFNIKYQPFSVGAGMTNTLKIKLAADNCSTILLSIPQRNMHTQVEVCDKRDIDSLIEMTYQYIIDLDKKLN